MRSILIALCASLAVASPALANETRFEARGGVIWDSHDSEAIAGVAVGHDYDLAPRTFIGAEVSADKVLARNAIVSFGLNARAGLKLPLLGKAYATGGYATKYYHGGKETWNLGAGIQHDFLPMTYGKIEYRHYFVGNGLTDADAAAVGIGLKF